MAHISIRYLFRILTHHHSSLLLLPNKQSSFFSLPFYFSYSSSSSCFPYIQERPISVYHPSVDLLNLCKNTRHLFQIQSQIITCGLFPYWSAKLLKHYSDFGDINYTILIFNHIDFPGTFIINNVIKAYSLSSKPQHALVFYFQMLKDGYFFPNSYTSVSLFGACSKMGCAQHGKMFHGQALKNGVDRVLPVQNSLVHLYGCCGDVEFAQKMFDEMSQRDLVSWNSIINAYVSVGELGIAHGIFDVMSERNVVSWNIMINGYLKGNNPGCGLKLFRKMVRSGLRWNDATIVNVISVCGKSARLKEGRSVHGFLIRTSLSLSTILYTSLIDMYSRCRKAELAQRIFDRLEYRNLICWNAMIVGHCIHGNLENGIRLFAEMVDWAELGDGEAIIPDEVTCIGILCACARAGLVQEGRNFFSQMMEKYSLKPNFAHYWCMANLYAGVGLIQEAENVLRNMPDNDENVSSESLVWTNLLCLSCFQANYMLGERIAKSLIDRDPWNFSHYQFLLNVYAVAGKWHDVARVKEMVKKRRIGRIPQCNLVDLKEIVHKYRVGNYWQEGSDENNMMRGEVAETPSL